MRRSRTLVGGFVLLLLGFGMVGPAPAAPATPPAPSKPTADAKPAFVKKVYKYRFGRYRFNPWVYRFEDTKTRPVLVWIHGGALLMGIGQQVPQDLLDLAKAEGFIVVSLHYYNAPMRKLPGIIEDITHEINWIRKEGPKLFHADPEKMVIAGGSAGGYLTMMTGICVKPRPTALVAYYGYGDVDGDWYTKPHYHTDRKLLTKADYTRPDGRIDSAKYYIYLRQNGLWTKVVTGFDPATQRDQLTPYCPVRNITPGYPPIMMLHGTLDNDVPFQLSVDMAKELARHGVEHKLVAVHGGHHGLNANKHELLKAHAFIIKHLKPETVEAATRRPIDFREFVSVKKYASVAEAIRKESYICFPRGSYVVDNPIVIDRDRPLFLHGGDRIRTRLSPKNPGKPLLVIKRATLVHLAGMRLHYGNKAIDARNILTENRQPIRLEMRDCFSDTGALDFRGPGQYVIQSTFFAPRSILRSPLVVDHPAAECWLVGGNISNHGNHRFKTDPGMLFHVWQKRGHLEIFGTGFQAAPGIADVRIDSPSPKGAHFVVKVRTEGANGANKGTHRSVLLYTPKTDRKVNVVLTANTSSTSILGRGNSSFADYHGAGTLWLVGNNSSCGVGSLVTGDAPEATIVALGNHVYANTGPLTVRAKRTIGVGNVYQHGYATGRDWNTKDLPWNRFTDDNPMPADVPPIPQHGPIPVVKHTPMTTAPPTDILKSVKDFGAIGDGKADDTDALQRALAEDMLYLPAGTYRITRPLIFRKADGKPHGQGGWIAGAGSGRTVILRESGSVLQCPFLAFATVQGIAFKTKAYGDEANFYMGGVGSQEAVFYDCRFIGGKYGLGLGILKNSQVSENMMIDCVFADAGWGLCVGGFNALANYVHGCRFVSNHIAMGHGPPGVKRGGTWSVFSARITRSRKKDLQIFDSAGDAWYFHDLTTNAYKVYREGDNPWFKNTPESAVLREEAGLGKLGGGKVRFFGDNPEAVISLVFENCLFRTSRPPKWPIFEFKSAGGGMIFLHSTFKHGGIQLGGYSLVNTAFSLHSTIPDWGKFKPADPKRHRMFKLD